MGREIVGSSPTAASNRSRMWPTSLRAAPS